MNHETFHSFMLEYFIAILAFSMVNGLCHWKCFNFDIQILIKMADSSENWLCLLSHINCELSTWLNEFIEHILCMKHSIQQKCLFALEICSLLFNLSLFEFLSMDFTLIYIVAVYWKLAEFPSKFATCLNKSHSRSWIIHKKMGATLQNCNCCR